ncbi:Na+/H+ antiporter family protein [Pseudomaricurvus sp. HS19]|uniref:Na+/H+ antiporter family protein n=1 Tax=Pseudomaricurvus sp. HS19 TaxID=2692626 RepID=UPI0013694A6F|nr:Na+/H+ antiporter NhaC family protein [Pseudomaricurvus sp. HS19]MYM64208.1 sodium:proton antiporter [Pseudomaricurvus sp. HS19]
MNAVVIAVAIMLGLSLMRINVVLSLVLGGIVGGVVGGLSLTASIEAFNGGLGGGATVALSYALLGAFAVAIEKSGLPDLLAAKVHALLGRQSSAREVARIKYLLLSLTLLISVCSQNLVPVHIAFIPMLIPPLLHLLHELRLDRRLIACILTFGLTMPYMILPIGFGGIFMNEILLKQLQANGLSGIDSGMIPAAMAIPVAGMVMGLLIAVFYTYRKPRDYTLEALDDPGHPLPESVVTGAAPASGKSLMPLLAIVLAFAVQLTTESIVAGALVGYLVFLVGGVFSLKESNDVVINGMKLMAQIGFVMIAASGFSEVIKATGDIGTLVDTSAAWIGNNQALAAFAMLGIGLLITMGIGSSFSTVPIIAAVYVPLALQLGFSPLAIIALVGTAGALGDAGSPASDSTLGPTMGLNADGQHDHIWDSVVPTFIHYNIPLIIFGWLAAMWL